MDIKGSLKELSIFYYGKRHSVGEIIVDAVVKESHELRALTTEHPTESGESFVDHVQIKPTILQIEAIITNTRSHLMGLPFIQSVVNLVEDKKNQRKFDSNNLAEIAFRKLEEIFAKRKPITISTTLKDYDNMVLESLSVERTSQSAASLHFKASAKQIRLVKQALIDIPAPKNESVQPVTEAGKQDSKLPSKETFKSTESLMKWGLDKLGGMLWN